jgi:APA family basic amino acid/polyamine antiporter
MTPQVLSTEYLENPLAGIVQAFPFGGDFLARWIGILAAVVLFVAANAGLMGASRLSFHMGEFFQIPRFIYRLHPKFNTPYIALTIFAVLGIAVIIWSWGKLAFLADLYSFGAMTAFFFAHISLIRHRIRFPDEKRPFKIKWNIWIKGYEIPITGILGAISTASVWLLVVITKPHGRYLGLGWIALGLCMYLYNRKIYNIPATGHVDIEKIKVGKLEQMEIKQILVPIRGGTSTETILFACQIAKAFGARLKVLHVVEIPFFMPLNASVLERETFSEEVLKRAKAIGNELGVSMELKMVRSRSVYRTIYKEIIDEKPDALVIGASHDPKLGVGSLTQQLLKTVPCYVFICRHHQEMTSLTCLKT